MFSKTPAVIFKLCMLMICFPTNTEATCLNSFHHENVPSPINIESSRAIKIKTKTPVTLHNALFGFLNFTNTGRTLIAYTNQLLDPSSVTGSVLCVEKVTFYKIHSIEIYINQDINGRSGHAFDGKGLPIEVWVIYYEKSYGSLKNALKFPNSVVVLAFPVGVSTGKPSVSFLPFQIFLSSGIVKKPHSSSKLFGLLGYSWFSHISNRKMDKNAYYAYTGSYNNLETGEKTLGVKFVVGYPEHAPLITYDQFSAFQKVLGYDGKPINFTLPIHPQGQTKVITAESIEQKFIPIV